MFFSSAIRLRRSAGGFSEREMIPISLAAAGESIVGVS